MKKNIKSRVIASLLATILLLTNIISIPYAPFELLTNADLLDEGWPGLCIDGTGFTYRDAKKKGDIFTEVNDISISGLNSEEQAYAYWAILSYLSRQDTDKKMHEQVQIIKIKDFVGNVNANIASGKASLPKITALSEAEIKAVIHSDKVKSDHPWLQKAVEDPFAYLKAGGLSIGSGSGSTQGGGSLPAELQNTSESNPYELYSDTGNIFFPVTDTDFLNAMQGRIEFLQGNNGWVATFEAGGIRFANTLGSSANALVRFNTAGTAYASTSGSLDITSPEQLYAKYLIVFECTFCGKQHFSDQMSQIGSYDGSCPLDWHQRLALAGLPQGSGEAFLKIGGTPAFGAEADLVFNLYMHEEIMKTNYNVDLYKYDHETGIPLENAVFEIWERFDDKAQISDTDGPSALFRDNYVATNPVTWDGWGRMNAVTTDGDGKKSYTDIRSYEYRKTFCDGHPAPSFGELPEEISDPETGDPANGAEVEAVRAANQDVAAQWLWYYNDCDDYAKAHEGIHFHWLMDGVSESDMEAVLGDGNPVYGETAEPSGDESYEKSGCREDCERTYEKFVKLQYTYVLRELSARNGYIVHGNHPDDLPIEAVTTISSQAGANSRFAGEYGRDITEAFLSLNEEKSNYQESKVAFEANQEPEEKERSEELTQKTGQLYHAAATYVMDQLMQPDIEEEETVFSEADTATPSVAGVPKKGGEEELRTATHSNGIQRMDSASPSNGKKKTDFISVDNDLTTTMYSFLESALKRVFGANRTDYGREDFSGLVNAAFRGESVGPVTPKGPDSRVSHTYKIYDHRTEGEIHFNKQDLDLKLYGESQGDATLEGAVYGLFALENITLPDNEGHTVYRQNDLAAIAATDRNGDASFLAFTEKPNTTYDYGTGRIKERADGIGSEVRNLYTAGIVYDDYMEDGRYVRTYADNESNNGNCWIGRPLILGKYCIKELSRSEGYELSVNGKSDPVTNYGKTVEISIPEGSGSTRISRGLHASAQEDSGGEAELLFEVQSKDTHENGFDLVIEGYPMGTKFYRQDTGIKREIQQVGTGVFEEQTVTDEAGRPVSMTAESNTSDIKRNPDGTPQTVERNSVRDTKNMVSAPVLSLDAAKTTTSLNGKEVINEGVSEYPDQVKNREGFILGGREINTYVKAKAEAALRANGYLTPKNTEGGRAIYSAEDIPVYNRGVRKGDPDNHGASGVPFGDPADKTVYGSPVTILEIPKSSAVTNLQIINGVLNFYELHPWYNYGGIDRITEDDSHYFLTLYTNTVVSGSSFLVLGPDAAAGSIIYSRMEYVPDDTALCPRYVLTPYSNDASVPAFGVYENLKEWNSGGAYRASATLVPDAYVDGSGVIRPKTYEDHIYYKMGELVRDKDGNPVLKKEWVQKTEEKEVEVPAKEWTELPADYDILKGKYILHVDSSYTDALGSVKTDLGRVQNYGFKSVTMQKKHSLTEEDITALDEKNPFHWAAGDDIGYGIYLIYSRKAKVTACLDYKNINLAGEDSFIESKELFYPGQEQTYADGNTRIYPVSLFERPIKQKIKITKNLTINKDGGYDDNTGLVYPDGFEENMGGADNAVPYLNNFRFKIYLKSNLERLYRNEAGEITWQDRNGTIVDPEVYQFGFVQPVQPFYTKVLHKNTPLMKNSSHSALANGQLYLFTDGSIDHIPAAGYTRILETPDGQNNYAKFFQGIHAANLDKWDQNNPFYTSHKPNQVNSSAAAKENALHSDSVRQFAITWYLSEEVKKLVQETSSGEKEPEGEPAQYPDDVYDRALLEAIRKAENYLLPFYSYDLDNIYSINWDGEAGGGRDGDPKTLSADQKDEDYDVCYGLSSYLPYGTYITVEQQPGNKDLNDFYNKHFRTAPPKEISLPAVYEGGKTGAYEGDYNPFYFYDPFMTPEELASAYNIRWSEEWAKNHTEDLKTYVIQAHNQYGDFEIYKYGLDLHRLSGAHRTEDYAGFQAVQDHYDPVKDYYNDPLVASEKEGGHPDAHYYGDDQNKGRVSDGGRPYEEDGIEKIYHYGSVSEHRSGTALRSMMEGMQSSEPDQYAPMLVPWSVEEPLDENADTAPNEDGSQSGFGYAYERFTNKFYAAYLRIEKLDVDTGENILHDGAVFALYAAAREDGRGTDGKAKFYDTDTQIFGGETFLKAMGAKNITPYFRLFGAGSLYTGIVAAGTPICIESGQVMLRDLSGAKTGLFEAFTTTRDGDQADEENPEKRSTQSQNAGYLKTPRLIGAGVYVLAEIRPTAGYSRMKPVAIEVYSDKISYYQNGNQNDLVAAAVYSEEPEPGDAGKANTSARIYVSNQPVRLETSKVKEADRELTYLVGTRAEGAMTELTARYGAENLNYAYSQSGAFLGYGWEKGTLDYLEARKAAGEKLEPVYENGVFSGYGRLTRAADRAQDRNRFIPGATMTLYDAVEVKKNGDSGDQAYEGVTVTRDSNSNVKSVRVEKGYGGSQIQFVKERADDLDTNAYTYANEINDTGDGTWTYKTVYREAEDLLFYPLGGLTVTKQRNGVLWGYDENGNTVQIKGRASVFALKNGRAVFELTGAALDQVAYSAVDKCFMALPDSVSLYHLDSEGNRDALVDPVTGMAYVIKPVEGANGEVVKRILVWPVNVAASTNGAVISRDKIKTWRIASINTGTGQEYITGSYTGTGLEKRFNPVLNAQGLPVYYQKSPLTYEKGKPVYDIDGDYVRYRYTDLLAAFNFAAYRINDQADLAETGDPENKNDDKPLFYRQGESFVMENTWVSGERWPNDPFQKEETSGQADQLKRVIPGSYIMEELKPPSGYAKGFPEGVLVPEEAFVSDVSMTDEAIKVEITKTDAPDKFKIAVESDYEEEKETTEGKGTYSYKPIKGSCLALYRAKRIYTLDDKTYPNGYYLEKTETKPVSWTYPSATDNKPVTITAEWVSDGMPKYFEGIPAGDYILEESQAAAGFIRNHMEIEVKAAGQLQSFNLKNDHTKLEVLKYEKDSHNNRQPLSGSELSLYEAVTKADGSIAYENGLPLYDDRNPAASWITEDVSQYTDVAELTGGFLNLVKTTSSFVDDFEEAYESQGEQLKKITWQTKSGERSAAQTGVNGESQLWETDRGKAIRITIGRGMDNRFTYEYQFHYEEVGQIRSYDTITGIHRIDYLPFNGKKDEKPVGNYVLVETKAPQGYAKAEPKAVVLRETVSIQRFGLLNVKKFLDVEKVIRATESDGTVKDYPAPGVKLALYRAGMDGEYIEDPAWLVDAWTSGSDGVYTEEERLQGMILNGYEAGDYKPHRISPIKDGAYYVTETEVAAHMVKNPPQKILMGTDMAAVYRVINHPSLGRLIIQKSGEDTGQPLENARFQVKNEQTDETFFVVTDESGKAVLEGLSVGMVQTDGTIVPYWYHIREVTPPQFYQVTENTHRFQFDGTKNTEIVAYEYKVEDAPTEIHFTKTNFDTGMMVEGAVIEIHKARVRDGRYEPEGEAIERITTTKDGFTIHKKLAASGIYIAREVKTPAGMTTAPPLIFEINASGTGIGMISNDFGVIKLAGDGDIIKRMTVLGRVPVRVYQVLKNMETKETITVPGNGTEVILTESDGIQDGAVYEITEFTEYSDGNRTRSAKTTMRVQLSGDGCFHLPSRTFIGSRLKLADTGGDTLDTWDVDPENKTHTIENPAAEIPEPLKITSIAGRDGAAVKAGDILRYEIEYQNDSNAAQSIEIQAELSSGLEYMRSTANSQASGQTVVWNLENIPGGGTGSVELTAAVTAESNVVFCKARITMSGGKGWIQTGSQENPVVPEGSFVLINRLTGAGAEPEDVFSYKIRFTDSSGKTLTGYQSYSGIISGRIKGEGVIQLKGEGSVTFDGLPFGTGYQVIQEEKKEYETMIFSGAGVTGRYVSGTIFKNHRNDEKNRDVLKAKNSYVLEEITYYTGEGVFASGRYQFTVSENLTVDNIDMKDRPINVAFSKRDIASDEEIPGGRYQLLDFKTEQVLYEYTKAGDVKIPSELLKAGGTYIIREILSPDGYAYSSDIIFTADFAGTPETVVMHDRKTEVYFSKQDITTGKELIGGHYRIRDKETGMVLLAYTATGERVKLEGGLIAGRTYEFIEDLSPAGYAYAETVEFKVPLTPGSVTVVMEDRPTRVEIQKLAENIEGGETVFPGDGFKLKILQEDKTPAVAVCDFGGYSKGEELIFTTGKDAIVMERQLEAGKSYWLHELEPKDGYAFSPDVPFTVGRNGEKDVVIMVDRPTQVWVSKKTITGEEEQPGNEMSILDQDENTLVSWVSKDQAFRVTGILKAGNTYILREVSPKGGYFYAADISFQVSLDGKVDQVTMRNQPTEVYILKKDSSGRLLKGAVMQILDETKKNIIISDFETTGEPIAVGGILKAGNTYWLKEVKAPEGYLLAADVLFTLPKTPEILEVSMTDYKIPEKSNDIHLKKVDADTGQGLAGCEFTIFKWTGAIYKTVATGKDGCAYFLMPPDGTYTYKETKAPPGYLLVDDTYSFTIENQNIRNSSIMAVEDHKIPEIPIQKIDAATSEPLQGIQLELYNQDDSLVFTGVTDENGMIYFYPTEIGPYLVIEEKAPQGYQQDENGITFTVESNGTVKGALIFYNYPEKEKKRGYIVASYGSNLENRGRLRIFGGGRTRIITGVPKTGEFPPDIKMAVIWLMGLVFLTVYIKRRKKQNGKTNKI